MAAGLAIFVLILAANEGLDRYQAYAMQQRRDKLAVLEELAMSTLRGNISSVAMLGDRRYRVEIVLRTAAAAAHRSTLCRRPFMPSSRWASIGRNCRLRPREVRRHRS